MPNPKHHEEAPCDLGKALFEPFYLFFLLIVSDRSPWQRKKMVTLPARRTGLIFFVLFLALFFFFFYLNVWTFQLLLTAILVISPPNSDLIFPPLLLKNLCRPPHGLGLGLSSEAWHLILFSICPWAPFSSTTSCPSFVLHCTTDFNLLLALQSLCVSPYLFLW